METRTNRRVVWGKRLIVIGLVLALLGTLIAFLNQTDFGRITVKPFKIITDEGLAINCMMYIPDGVSQENPAPCAFAVHGGNSSRYAMANYAQEFARRGYVVVSLDQPSNGQSDRGVSNFFGTEDVMKFITTLEFVDQSKLVVMGHSMGNTVVSMAEANPQFGVKGAMALGSGASTAPDAKLNVCVQVGIKDENTGPRGSDTAVLGPAYYPVSSALASFLNVPAGTEITSGFTTGSLEDDSLRQFNQPGCGHLGMLYSSEGIAMALEFMGKVLGISYTLDVNSQTWIIREFATAAAFIGLFVVSFGIISLMLGKRKEAALEETAQGHATPNAAYWIGLVLMCIVPAVGIQELYMAGKSFFLALSPDLFAMEHISGVIFWMLCTAVMVLVISLVVKKFTKNYDWSFDKQILSISPKRLAYYLGIAVTVTVAQYLLVCLAGFFFNVCIRLFNSELHPFTLTRFGVFWVYLPMYLIYYIIIGYVQTSSLLCKNQPVWSQYVRTILVSVLAPGVMLALWYGSVGITGVNTFFEWRFVLGVLLNFLPGIAVGAGIQVYSYHRTGKIWLGALTNAILFTWMSTSIGVMISPT